MFLHLELECLGLNRTTKHPQSDHLSLALVVDHCPPQPSHSFLTSSTGPVMVSCPIDIRDGLLSASDKPSMRCIERQVLFMACRFGLILFLFHLGAFGYYLYVRTTQTLDLKPIFLWYGILMLAVECCGFVSVALYGVNHIWRGPCKPLIIFPTHLWCTEACREHQITLKPLV